MTERYYYNGSFINDRQDNNCLSSIQVADRLNQYERRIDGAVKKIKELKKSLNYHKEMHQKYEKQCSYIILAENQELKNELQDLTDNINNYFLEHEQELSDDLKSQAHLELGVEFEYDY